MINDKLEQAVAHYQNGDSDSFAYIYDNTYKIVFFTIFQVLGDRSLSEDIMQDVYLKVWQSINSYRSDNFIAWINRIAKNLAINEYHKRKRVENVDVQDYDERFSTEDNSEYGLVNIARKVLDEQSYSILIMCVVSGYKRREVSKILDIPISTVSYKLNKSLNILKDSIKENGL